MLCYAYVYMHACVCVYVYACMLVGMDRYCVTQAILSPSHPTARTNEWTAVAYTRIPERAAVFDSIQREFKCVRLRVRLCLSVFLVCTHVSYAHTYDPVPSFRNGGRDEGGEKGRGVRMRPALGDPSNMDTPAPPGAARWPSCLHKLACVCASTRTRARDRLFHILCLQARIGAGSSAGYGKETQVAGTRLQVRMP